MSENNPHPACSAFGIPLPTRRAFLAGTTLGVLGGSSLGWLAHQFVTTGDPVSQPPIPTGPPLSIKPRVPSALAMPGPYPGRVVEVHHPGSLGQAKTKGYTERNSEAIQAMLARGMKELVGCEEALDAWRSFFLPGDRVGIKVVPVGKPDSISSYELIREIVACLTAVGVRRSDILVFERYRRDFFAGGYPGMLPEGIHWECSSVAYDDLQLELDGQLPGRAVEDHVVGYDPDVSCELAYCHPRHDPKDDRRFRSHLSTIITRKVDKFISIPVLKDHRSAGVTLALKNLSHGLVNNVCRSHVLYSRRAGEIGSTLNQCNTFIPAIAAMTPIREKAVLHILDGLVGTWEGGPQISNKTFATWQYQSLFFATDPVALDRVGWEIIDRKRTEEGWPGVARMGLDAETGIGKVNGRPYPEQLHIRQPQHIPLAETLGLGVFDAEHIDHKRIQLT